MSSPDPHPLDLILIHWPQYILCKGAAVLIGYARISTTDQNLDLQIDALEKAGCDKIFRDTVSGANADRPGLAQAMTFMREGDVFVVWKLDRLGRSLRDLMDIISALRQRGIGFRVLQESIDTTTPAGELIFHIFGALAEFERALIRQRAQAGLQAARARGRKGGRPKKLNPMQETQVAQMLADTATPIRDIEALFQTVSRTTLYRIAKRANLDNP
jgi:DNA invertase Pin-like site-specific DNA recombinase